jgi:hypothetical protein
VDAVATSALIGFGLILGCFFAARILAAVRLNKPRLPPLSVYGDFPHIPSELRGAAKLRGEGSAKAARAQTQTSLDRTHRDGAVTK